ncbi:MAG: SDR family oxidoreductase [Chlamydiota bacterium]
MSNRILVVGGTHGIGRVLKDLLVEQGDEVITIARSEGVSFQCDVVNFDQELPNIEGPLHGLVYCPGTVDLKPFGQLSLEDFKRDWEVNALGAFRLLQNYLPQIKQADFSSIVLFSTVAVKVGMPFHSSISAAKGAVEGMTRSLAAELAPKIRVNAIAPSLTDTPLVEGLLSSDAKRQALGKRHPLDRVGNPEDIAKAAAFLLSEDSSWVTGQVIGIDGGMSTLKV